MNKILLPIINDNEKFAFTVDNVFSEDECKELIDKTEHFGYVQAQVNVGKGKEIIMTDYRNSLRCIVDNEILSLDIFNRVEKYLPKYMKNRKLLCINERLRFLKYLPGHFFKPHCDVCYRNGDNTELSYLTILLYLNDGSIGGSTRFSDRNDTSNFVDVIPKAGRVLVFQHDIYHEGVLVTDGVKYVMRSDIMFDNSPFI